MLNFYKKAFITFIALAVISIALGYVLINRTFPHDALLPAQDSAHAWRMEAVSDISASGRSSIEINDATFGLNVGFKLSEQAKYPYVSLVMVFAETHEVEKFVDLSQYRFLDFSVKCKPANVLTFSILTIDDKVTDPKDLGTYRIPTSFFSCNEQWQKVEIDLTRLETPQWWLSEYGLELSRQAYRLDKVPRITFGNSFQSPFDIESNVQIEQLVLRGTNWRYLYIYAALMFLVWSIFAVWIVKLHTKNLMLSLTEKLQKDRPLIAYQQLSLDSPRDRGNAAILRYMATEYANPELNLEMALTNLAVSRTKLNDVLREELGYTFVTYLNKLRLTEAARLLATQQHLGVTEISYSVGYKNVSYFHKLFKNEYGCAPKTFRDTYKPKNTD
ncbi:AraC family transcriptional regulator [Teredinibacter waterburyi]|uniref:AraC family transcriptional regulator n=1 Tax=Teredinibacter waterburyi TaxID=1500538 RepID=UPI00165FD7B8|nr:helix-turn-helix domain-containing protein [Teredinibacter waterburyi]